MESRAASAILFRFATFEVDTARKTLPRSATRIKIQDQLFRLLLLLREQPGEIVNLKALLENLRPKGTYAPWPVRK